MSNMSYCRFQNTAPDLQDCMQNMDEIDQHDPDLSDNNKSELRARKRLIEYCVDIAVDYGHEIGREVEEA